METSKYNNHKRKNNIGGFTKNPLSTDDTVVSNRSWCKTCRDHIYTDHPTMGLIDAPTVVVKDIAFKPEFHVHYQESILPMKDGLSKFKDLPKKAGGSGDELREWHNNKVVPALGFLMNNCAEIKMYIQQLQMPIFSILRKFRIIAAND